MRAWQVTSTTDDDGLAVVQIPAPDPEDGTVVEVVAAGVGYPDLLMRRGEFQISQTPPFTLGWEAAGRVVAPGAGSPFAVGDHVVTMSFGAWADRLVAEPSTTFPLPDGLTFDEGAAFPLNSLTALAALRRGRVGSDDVVLVHGASGGAGSACVQLAAAVGARVVAVVSTAVKAEVARRAGAHEVVSTTGRWRDEVREITSGHGVDVVIDPVGGDRFTDSLRCLAPEGRLVVVGFAAGSIPTLAVNRLLLRNVDVCGCSWSVLAEHPGGFAAAATELAGHVAAGHLRPIVDHVYDFERAPEALAALAARRATGKLVLDVGR